MDDDDVERCEIFDLMDTQFFKFDNFRLLVVKSVHPSQFPINFTLDAQQGSLNSALWTLIELQIQ